MPTAVLPLSLGALLVGIVLLSRSIPALVREVRASVIHRLPLVAEQKVEFDAAETYVLHAEGKRFSTAFRGVEFSLRDDALGREVATQKILLRSQVSGLSKVRISLRRFTVERPGEYTLCITGLEPGRDYSDDAVLFTRQGSARQALRVLSIVLGGLLTIGGLVLSILAASGAGTTQH